MHRIPQDRYTRHEVTASRAGSPSGRTAFWGTGMGEFRVSGFSLPAKMTHLSDDKTVAKMGHPTVVVPSDVGHPSTQLWRYFEMWATQAVDARYQLFLSGEGKVSCGFRYLKNHPAEAVERKPKPTRRITVIRTPTANVIMLPPWS
jgi:hypothetical protein